MIALVLSIVLYSKKLLCSKYSEKSTKFGCFSKESLCWCILDNLWLFWHYGEFTKLTKDVQFHPSSPIVHQVDQECSISPSWPKLHQLHQLHQWWTTFTNYDQLFSMSAKCLKPIDLTTSIRENHLGNNGGKKRGWWMKKELKCDNGFRKELIETTIPTKKELLAGIVYMWICFLH